MRISSVREQAITSKIHPGEYLREELEARGWTQKEFAQIIGWPTQLVVEIINGKAITEQIAKDLGETLGTGLQLWINLESVYRNQ